MIPDNSNVNYITPGMAYLHRVGIVHGRLSGIVCLIDARWNVKISHWQMLTLSVQQHDRKLSGEYGGGVASAVTQMGGAGGLGNPSTGYAVAQSKVASSRLAAGTMSNRPIDMCAMAPELRKDPEARPTKSSDAYSFRLVTIECDVFLSKQNNKM